MESLSWINSPVEGLLVGTLVVFVIVWLPLMAYAWGGNVLRLGLLWSIRRVYRVRARGLENLPVEGGALLVCNHVSYVDALVLAAVSPRPIRFLSADYLQRKPLLGAFLRWAKVIPVSPERSKEAIRTASECLRRGEVVGIFPEGRLSRDGRVNAFKSGFELIARRGGAPVVPVNLGGLWGSIFSFAGGRFFWKLPRKIPYPVHITMGLPTDPRTMTADQARQTVLDLGVDAYEQKPELQEHLAWRSLLGLKANLDKELIVDRAQGRRGFKGGVVLALALGLAKRLRRECHEERIGLVLPPGAAGVVGNLAVVLAGKTPVNLNFTLGREAVTACIERAGIKTIMTVGPIKEKIDEKCPGFPWTEKQIDVKDALQGMSKLGIALRLAAAKLLPAGLLATLFGVPRKGGRAEAAILFTSGSDGAPKGVVLSHRNLIANCVQISLCRALPINETMLANLPIFHSFGFTVTVWVPLLYGLRTVYTPTPLDFKLAARAIREEKCGILLGTPTFFRPYLKRVDAADLASLKLAIAGAEKTPKGFHQAWEERFPKCFYLEGYGLTETTPVVGVNEPDILSDNPDDCVIGTRSGSIGRLFPGMAVRIRSLETDELQPLNQTGIVEFKGPNVFEGYLDEPEKTASVLREGWLTTGDLGRVDQDGFLYIEGRISRFSKIGGEMVPHGTVETAVARALGVDDSEIPLIAVSARQDPAKGEALVLLAAIDIDREALARSLAEAGLANLWIPREVRRVEEIPTLGSGKLDIKALKDLANTKV
ncbi:AMP-binding protein [Ruficoccus amylovorans]|uniref:AMP-binding protein n=1 Tax=Ruficoccus amylovorans TaxID=1804625 RepID=A0A842HHU3_9BACT|nr:AMP-binding protein [Ruficoccus amylovorans]MBC2595134.1 AMP-binding protein [Ruficoccus amylovorans]